MKHSDAYTKLKNEIKGLSGFSFGWYYNFWLGYIHGIYDYSKYGELTEEEGIKLENMMDKRLAKLRNVEG